METTNQPVQNPVSQNISTSIPIKSKSIVPSLRIIIGVIIIICVTIWLFFGNCIGEKLGPKNPNGWDALRYPKGPKDVFNCSFYEFPIVKIYYRLFPKRLGPDIVPNLNDYKTEDNITIEVPYSSVQPTQSQTKTFQSQNNYSFSFPSNWDIRVINVKKNERFQEGVREYIIKADDTGEPIKETFYDIDVYARYADTEHVILTINSNWQLRFSSFKSNSPHCTLNIEMGPNAPMLDTLKQLKNGSFNLSRQAYEKGWSWSAPGPAGSEAIPRSQFVFNKRENINRLNTMTTYLDSCIFNNPKQTQLEIEYFSPYFTGINFPEDKMGTEKPAVIDESILNQMDAIVESLDF